MLVKHFGKLSKKHKNIIEGNKLPQHLTKAIGEGR